MTDTLDRAVDAALDGMPNVKRTAPTRPCTTNTASDGPAVDDLIRRGEQSPSARTRRAAERARSAVDALRAALNAEQAEQRAAERVAALKQQLDDAKAELRRVRSDQARTPQPSAEPEEKPVPDRAPGREPTAVPTRKYQPGVDYVASTVRAWARENGWAHPRKGRFCPPALVAEYLTDTGGQP